MTTMAMQQDIVVDYRRPSATPHNKIQRKGSTPTYNLTADTISSIFNYCFVCTAIF